MAVLEITSRQFRDNQKSYFDLVDSGSQVVIRRRSRQAYALTPIDNGDLYFTPEMEAKIERAMQQIERGECTTLRTKEEIRQYLDRL